MLAGADRNDTDFIVFVARNIAKQVVDGLLYLHSHGILHRDIKLSNLLLTNSFDVVSRLHSIEIVR